MKTKMKENTDKKGLIKKYGSPFCKNKTGHYKDPSNLTEFFLWDLKGNLL